MMIFVEKSKKKNKKTEMEALMTDRYRKYNANCVIQIQIFRTDLKISLKISEKIRRHRGIERSHSPKMVEKI